MARPDRIEIGYVARPHGIRGDVSVRLYNPGSTILDEVVLVTLEGPGDLPRRSVALESSRSGGEHCQVRLEGVADRTAAEALVGAKLFVDREQLPELDEGEYYHFELIGLQVVDEAGEPVGKIEEIYSTPANDIYVVRGAKVGELLVPAIEAYIRGVDLEKGTVTLARLEDLLEE